MRMHCVKQMGTIFASKQWNTNLHKYLRCNPSEKLSLSNLLIHSLKYSYTIKYDTQNKKRFVNIYDRSNKA